MVITKAAKEREREREGGSEGWREGEREGGGSKDLWKEMRIGLVLSKASGQYSGKFPVRDPALSVSRIKFCN